MKFGTFLFTQAEDKSRDHEYLQETLTEARVSEELGMDAVWLAEHHFDGTLAYVDPISFAAALAMATKRVKIGTAVIQAALHHPIRVAEQLALIDHLSEGRLIAGMGKGTMYNPYEYTAFGVDAEIANERFDEMEALILKCWTGERVEHRGKYWSFDIPMLRPLPFTKPHPPLIRATGSEAAALAQAKRGRPFLTSGPNEAVKKRVALFAGAMREAGHDEAKIARTLDASWTWKNVIVADSHHKAEEIAIDTFQRTLDYRESLGMKSSFVDSYRASGVKVPPGYMYGTWETVLEQFLDLATTGIGGAIIRFRQGAMPLDVSLHSLRSFVKHIAPALRAGTLATVK